MDGATRCVLLLLLPLSNTPTWSCARVWVSCARLTWVFVWCFPPNIPRSSQQARYLYYQGFVRAVQLEYSEALRLLQVRSRFSDSAVWYPVFNIATVAAELFAEGAAIWRYRLQGVGAAVGGHSDAADWGRSVTVYVF